MSHEYEIQIIVDFHVSFNKQLGINCDDPVSRLVFKDLLMRLKTSEEIDNFVLHEDLDGFGDFDSDEEFVEILLEDQIRWILLGLLRYVVDLKLMSWNIRGLNDDLNVQAVRNAIRKNRVFLCTIQESKMECVSDSIVRSLWGSNNCEYAYLPSIRRSGGIIFLWNVGELVMEESLFTSIYGASDASGYAQFWQEITYIRTIMHEPWCLGGDWNAILSQSERNRAGGNTNNRRRFRNFLNAQNLMDLPMAGGRFTWKNSQNPSLLSRLDRFVVSADWEDLSLLQSRMKRPTFDHAPVLLSCN
ncbi:uncharacterized protein LOC113298047 [Papaver somniferum]|uniref:uncharacterized protein LOC113298047 n=1 Tax=Papaver somniferum TaxID=3469 RepID=UPI000E704ABC|nr:uncharacterized protein LOC113298047 [Papaver somniferum]XP_026402483.1 uncharacterized protein LOC113298047 [Papaver somniferum]XP_026402484.1 uncharacterized protein LOC113298047 [Papaver somniferum]XP_026402485.1 uncharacterized protein LOC113298047 [Papaver somniferum]